MKLIIFTHTNTETNKIQLEPYDLKVIELNKGEYVGKDDLEEIFKWVTYDDRLTDAECCYEIDGEWNMFEKERLFSIENVIKSDFMEKVMSDYLDKMKGTTDFQFIEDF